MSKKRTREQATKGNCGISPPNKRAGTAKTVRRRSNTIQTTISEWVLDEELPMSQYNSAGPHTQAADPHKYTTKPITTTPTPNHTNPICSPTSQITDNKSSDTNVDDQNDLNSIYDWASCNNMSFNAQKFQYICFSPHSSSSSNVYTSSSFDIINYSKNILDGINVSSDCSFDFHISNLVKRTKHLTGWILRTFSSRDKLTMLTLFKALVMSRLDYGCQLWSPYLIKHINMVEKVQRSFTRFISGMAGLSYTERLAVLKLYSLQRRRERYIVIYVWKILEGLVPNLYPPICAIRS